jgi:hypothetical protein
MTTQNWVVDNPGTIRCHVAKAVESLFDEIAMFREAMADRVGWTRTR